MIIEYFKENLQKNSDASTPVVSIQALSHLIQNSQATTMTECIKELEAACKAIQNATNHCISVTAGCELFMRVVTRAAADSTEDFTSFRLKLIERGRSFAERSLKCREQIAELGLDFISDGAVILVHCYSRVVMALLLRAAKINRRFSVLVTEAKPTSRGFKAARFLRQNGVPATVILDSAVAYYMEKVDMVLVGAEGVVENGGIINQIGTYLIAVMAKTADIPFYAVAESYKFVRCFPLNQYDLPSNESGALLFRNAAMAQKDDEVSLMEPDHPSVDYTPPSYISLLFTDLGVLTPSGVSDELIKLYY